MIGGKTGTRLFDGEPFTKYTVEIFPSAPEGGATGGSFNPTWIPGTQLPEAIYGLSEVSIDACNNDDFKVSHQQVFSILFMCLAAYMSSPAALVDRKCTLSFLKRPSGFLLEI